MQAKYYVREMRKEDSTTVLNLAMKSWKYTYKDIFTESFIESYVKRAYRPESLENIIEHANLGLSKFLVLVEKDRERIAGYAQIGYDRYWETRKKMNPLRLFRIYLDPKILGKGLGNLLLEKAEEFVKQENQTSYIVGVHEKNTIGLRFYKRMGFKMTSKVTDAEGEIYFKKTIE